MRDTVEPGWRALDCTKKVLATSKRPLETETETETRRKKKKRSVPEALRFESERRDWRTGRAGSGIWWRGIAVSS